MTMRARFLGAGVLTLAALFLVSAAQAGDTIRLGLSPNTTAPTVDLKATPSDADADTLPVFHRGGFVGHHGGYYGGYRGGYYGGYRGGYYGGYAGYRGAYYGGIGRYYGGYYG